MPTSFNHGVWQRTWQAVIIHEEVIADLVMMQATAISVYFVDVQWQSAVYFVDVQWQSDGSECALFALAFVADLCTSEDPASSRYDQMLR